MPNPRCHGRGGARDGAETHAGQLVPWTRAVDAMERRSPGDALGAVRDRPKLNRLQKDNFCATQSADPQPVLQSCAGGRAETPARSTADGDLRASDARRGGRLASAAGRRPGETAEEGRTPVAADILTCNLERLGARPRPLSRGTPGGPSAARADGQRPRRGVDAAEHAQPHAPVGNHLRGRRQTPLLRPND